MPALNYTDHNAILVKSGKKPHTIRQTRKRLFRVGDKLYHYNKQRSPECVKLGESIASIVLDCVIIPYRKHVLLDGYVLSPAMIESLAKADGFDDSQGFFEFFQSRLNHGMLGMPGQLIGWDDITFDDECTHFIQTRIRTGLKTLPYLKRYVKN